MRLLMRIPPGVNSDVLDKQVVRGLNGLSGSAFFGRFGEGVLDPMVMVQEVSGLIVDGND